MLSEPLQVVAQVVRALDQLDIPYVVGGSLASSIYGIPRATQDVDLVARQPGLEAIDPRADRVHVPRRHPHGSTLPSGMPRGPPAVAS